MSCLTQERGKADGTGDDLPPEKDFIRALYQFMRDRCSPIERIPSLGFKQIDLFAFYNIVQRLGGYEQVTLKQVWRQVYNGLGGNPRSTSAATCTRKHYEKLILPYERYLRAQEETLESPTKTMKRYNRGLYKDAAPEEPPPDTKRARMESPSVKEMPYSALCSINGFVMGYVPHITGYQQLWKEQKREYSSLTGLRTVPVRMQGAHLQSSEYYEYMLGNQQGIPNRNLAKPQVEQKPLEPQRHTTQENTECDRQELPLNLSSKRRSSETTGAQDLPPESSSTATCATPKFLNHVSSLYSSDHIQKIEGPLKSPPPASESNGNGRVPAVSDFGATTRLLPAIAVTSGKPEESTPGKQTLLDLGAGHFGIKTPTERMMTSDTVLKDSGQHSIARAPQQVLPVFVSPTNQTIPRAPGWHAATKSYPYCKPFQMDERLVCPKSEHGQKTSSNPLSKEPMNAMLHPFVKQNRFLGSLCCAEDPAMAISNNPELNPAVYGTAQEDRAMAVTTMPAFQIGQADRRYRLPEPCQVSCSALSTSPDGVGHSGSSSVALSNTGCHLEQYSRPPHASPSRPTHQSSHLGHLFQETDKVKYWSQDQPAMGSRSLDLSAPSAGRPPDHYYRDMKPKEHVFSGADPLRKYLPLESRLKQGSGTCFGGQMQTIPGHHQGLTLWNRSSHQREATQTELLKRPTVTRPIVS